MAGGTLDVGAIAAAVEAATFLKTVPLFAELEPAHLDEIARHARRLDMAAGTSIFRQGDEGDGLYVLASGKVHVTSRLLGQTKVAITQLQRGDLLGEMSLVDGRVRSASARCVEPTTAYFIRRTHFAMLRADLHPVALRLMRSLARLLAQRQRTFNEDISAISPPAGMGGHSRSIPPPAFDNATELPTSHLSREILRHLPTFDNLDAAEVDELLAYTTAWVLPRGHVLFERGQVGSSCYLIVRGAVRVALSQRGWSETLAILGPGRLFGHMALIDGAPRSATCVVRESAIILELTREVFDAWCSRRSPLAFKLLEMISCSLVDGLRQSGGLLARFAVEGRMTQQRVQNITLPAELLPILPSPDG